MNKGFTIVELISVIAILGLLAIIVTPAYDNVGDNIRQKNYDSRKSEIKSLTLAFVEKYAKDKVYNGNNEKICLYFSPDFLIKNGIISSDDEKDEYIKNEFERINYSGTEPYIKIEYLNKKFKIKATTKDEDKFLECNIPTEESEEEYDEESAVIKKFFDFDFEVIE